MSTPRINLATWGHDIERVLDSPNGRTPEKAGGILAAARAVASVPIELQSV
jgi:hypothetical protein